MAIVKQGMSDGLCNNRKMMSHSNLKGKLPEEPLDAVRGFLFQFSAIWEVWLPGVIT